MSHSHSRELGQRVGERPIHQRKKEPRSRSTRDTASRPDWTNAIKTTLKEVAFETGKELTKDTVRAYLLENQPELVPILEGLEVGESESEDETSMAGRGSKSRKRKPRVVRRRRGPSNGYLRAERIHVRDIVPWSEMKGTKNRWLYQVTLGSLIAPFVKTYDEFRVTNLRVRFLADAPEGGATGCYTGILMDQQGFGDFGIATGAAWFKSIACFPGSKLLHRGHPMTLTWTPTEPSAREWRRGEKEKGYVVATLYFADDGTQETEIGGAMLITGTVLARGRYWNIPTLRAHQIGKLVRGDDILSEIGDLEVV